ncbi:bifunctional ADP-dependent NAD(P)H-hydrate dehydratase/NAD(P)H-hydrate epimerase [Paenibacillus beijingensis]|uniref:bifunctional ADP-dependent NAD(P)H-hydrate dehydratase/NAD(P)H-hydrate epimerase n=1 Tax=Paenibacillus beijingensis TaxID=1126833 RepID=UPI0006960F8C|nr:bifunctional ADP-dependent NAD(P)H-hydrate dehydratase/NAD(P)H-hydrate epimerase [Paenibacillus beijingensis]
MELVSAETIREMERETIESIGIPANVLMETAGRALAEAVYRLHNGMELTGPYASLLPGCEKALARAEQSRKKDGGSGGREAGGETKPWAILVGKGSNGGDGLVAARHLAERGIGAHVVYAVPPEQLCGEAAREAAIAERLGLPAVVYRPGAVDWSGMGGIVDALLGTGSSGGAPREPLAALIREANASGLPVVAADIPSGLHPDTGQTADPCINAAATVTFALPKLGLAQFPGAARAGAVLVAPIGIAARAAQQCGQPSVWMLSPEVLRSRLEADPGGGRPEDSHKGTYGHVLAAAGSRAMSGAGLLCAVSALRSGAGLVTWAVPERLADSLIGVRPELMLKPLDDSGTGEWADVDPHSLARLAVGRDALVIGPGFGRLTKGQDPHISATGFGRLANGQDSPMSGPGFGSTPYGEAGRSAAEAASAGRSATSAAGPISASAGAGSAGRSGTGAAGPIGANAGASSAGAEGAGTEAGGVTDRSGPPSGEADDYVRRGWLRRLWDALPQDLPLVVDADALNHIAEAGDFAAWPRRRGGIVFTPHPGEMARLCGISTPEVQRDRIAIARDYAVRHGVTLVLKGARTVIALPDGTIYVNPTGNPGMATGGTGDVLAGLIAGLLAQGHSAAAAAALGVYRHGAAGDQAAARRVSPASMLAGDLLDEL